MNYFAFRSMQADSLHACRPVSAPNSFLKKMSLTQNVYVTIDMMHIECKQQKNISKIHLWSSHPPKYVVRFQKKEFLAPLNIQASANDLIEA